MSSNLYQIKKEIPIKEVDKELALEIQNNLYRLGYLNKRHITGKIDKETLAVYSQFKKDYGLSHPYLLGRIAAKLLIATQPKVIVNVSVFEQVFNKAKISKRNDFFVPFNRALKEFGFVDKKQLVDILTIVSWESHQFEYLEEVSGQQYERNLELGNNQRGDGQRYKGRGLIKIVGRKAYTNIGKALGLKLRQFPSLALYPENASRIACFYWCENRFKSTEFTKIACHFEGKRENREKLLKERDRIKSLII